MSQPPRSQKRAESKDASGNKQTQVSTAATTDQKQAAHRTCRNVKGNNTETVTGMQELHMNAWRVQERGLEERCLEYGDGSSSSLRPTKAQLKDD